MIISHLVALSNNLVIGADNDLPWKLKKDLQHFSSYTQNKAIIMGRKTYESIGRPLPNRKNIILSSSLNKIDGVEITKNLEDAMQVAENWNATMNGSDEIVLIGGGHVFKATINIVNKLVLTRVDCEIEGDTFYPEVDLKNWKKESTQSYYKDSENEYNFIIETYTKN
ncbi:MAG: dihydrofolate reductase [SAR86 cluster bacterium]|jgi:dihydrofolate reductase|nr:dihydrofolate reductase [SAR86 cluster bacterium]